MDYIEINYKTVTLNALAEVFNYSAGYLSRLIKQRFGRLLQSIITDLKMEQAVKLLESTDANMSTISEAVGYSDKRYFLRRFQKRYHRGVPFSFSIFQVYGTHFLLELCGVTLQNIAE